jgi:putative zinc finger protein
MAANDRALPAEPTDTGCPDLEDVAAFLDGTLPAERRAAMIEHLASCESCYELFAGAARFQAEELQQEAPHDVQQEAPREPQQTPQGDVGFAKGRADRPFEPPDRRRRGPQGVDPAKGRGDRWPFRSRAWRGAAAAIAALLVASAGLLPVWWRAGEISTAGLSAGLVTSPAAMQKVPWTGKAKRGADSPEVPLDLGDFRLGVRLLDLRLALAAGNKAAADETLSRLESLLSALWLPLPEIRAGYQGIRQELTRGTPPAALLPKADAEEKSLAAAGVERESVDLGRWTEACRLGAMARQPEIFRSRATRRLLERAQPPSTETGFAAGSSPDQRPAEILRDIKVALRAKQLDFDALASHCRALLEALDDD